MKKNKTIAFLVLMMCFWIQGVYAQNTHPTRDEIYDGNIDVMIKKMVEKKIAFNKSIKVGYCIQIYNGNEIIAQKIFEKIFEKYPNQIFFLRYKEPDWKVQTKIYHDKRIAKKVLKNIQKQFPNARIF